METKEAVKHFAIEIIEGLNNDNAIVTFDNPNHGVNLIQKNKNFSWSKGNKTHAMDMYSQMVQTSLNISLLIDFLPAYLNVKASKFSVVGISQGGHASLVSFGIEPRLAVCVSYISSGDYEMNMKLRYKKLTRHGSTNTPPCEELMNKQFLNTLNRFDPIKNLLRFSKGNRPVLIMNGKEDGLVPLECNVNFVKQLMPHYADIPKNLVHEVVEGAGHEVNQYMRSQGIQWLRVHLCGTDVSKI